jgi:hypothetical protein
VAERNSVFVFKGPSEEEFHRAMADTVAGLHGRLDWHAHPEPMKSSLLTSHNETVHAAYIHLKGPEISKGVGAQLGIPWMNLRIQEGTLWDYSLYEGNLHVDNFSTLPEYWDDDKEWQSTQRGRPEILARLLKIDQRVIENYLQPWGFMPIDDGMFETTLRGKAYPTDEFEYGDIWQINDFLRALGAHDPNFDSPHSIARGLTFPPSKRRSW